MVSECAGLLISVKLMFLIHTSLQQSVGLKPQSGEMFIASGDIQSLLLSDLSETLSISLKSKELKSKEHFCL